MDAARFREILDGLHLTPTELARMLEIDSRSARRFADGKVPVPPSIAEWLEMILKSRPPRPNKEKGRPFAG